MASGGARRGRRDNGLIAAAYAAVGDVDPRVGEHLLDVLGLRGIAAYLQPASDLHPVTRATMLPSRPTDRLYVDIEHVETARGYLTDLATGDGGDPAGSDGATRSVDPTRAIDPTSSAVDQTLTDAPAPGSGSGVPAVGSFDALFADIIAGFNDDIDLDSASWPEAENLSPGGSDGTGAPDEPSSGTGSPRALLRWQDSTIDPVRDNSRRLDRHSGDQSAGSADEQDLWRPQVRGGDGDLIDGLDSLGDALPEDDDEEGYTPPPPPPLPRVSPAIGAAVLAILAGVVVFFNPGLLPMDNTFAMVLGFAGIFGGFVALIWRLRPGGDDDDDPWNGDDGAVV